MEDEQFIALESVEAADFLNMKQIICANELAGISARVIDMTRDYVTQRKQFGVPVGGFQAVQHGIAEMHVQAECMRSAAEFAAWSIENSAEQAAFAGLSALSYACDNAPLIVEKAIQLHGGIGFTWEYDLHLYLRRVRTLAALYAQAVDNEQILKLAANL